MPENINKYKHANQSILRNLSTQHNRSGFYNNNLGERIIKMNREEKNQNDLLKYWHIILFAGLIIFNIGYTIAKLDNMITKEEAAIKISEAIQQYKTESEKEYIRQDQVPGLKESLKSLNDKFDDLEKRYEKFEEKNNSGNK